MLDVGIARRQSTLGAPVAGASTFDDDELDGMFREMTSQEERSAWRAAFETDDRRKRGEVSTTELGLLLRSLNLAFTNAELLNLVRMADIDGGGGIDYEEFTGVVLCWKLLSPPPPSPPPQPSPPPPSPPPSPHRCAAISTHHARTHARTHGLVTSAIAQASS